MKRKPAPKSLSTESRALWQRIMVDYDLASDIAGQELLLSLCQTLDRLAQCREAIEAEGLTVTGSTGQVRPHPLLAIEAENRRALLAHFRALKLESEDY